MPTGLATSCGRVERIGAAVAMVRPTASTNCRGRTTSPSGWKSGARLFTRASWAVSLNETWRVLLDHHRAGRRGARHVPGDQGDGRHAFTCWIRRAIRIVPETDVYDGHDYVQDPERFAPAMQELATGAPYVKHAGPVGCPESSLGATPGWSIPIEAAVRERVRRHLVESGCERGRCPGDTANAPRRSRSSPTGTRSCTILLGDWLCSAVRCQLTDVLQEQNGIYRYDRSVKFDMERIRARSSDRRDRTSRHHRHAATPSQRRNRLRPRYLTVPRRTAIPNSRDGRWHTRPHQFVSDSRRNTKRPWPSRCHLYGLIGQEVETGNRGNPGIILRSLDAHAADKVMAPIEVGMVAQPVSEVNHHFSIPDLMTESAANHQRCAG